MDSLDLLAREDEYKKLNKQLEKKTESLMKEIEHVMQKQDFFTEFSHSLSLTPHTTPKRPVCSPPQEPLPKPVFKRKTSSPKQTVETKNDEATLAVPTPPKQLEEVLPSLPSGDGCEKRMVCECCDHTRSSTRSDDAQFLQAFVSVGVQEKVFPQSFLKDNITVENICKFLSTKVKLMQEQIDKLQMNLDKKAAQCKTHLTHQAELEGERLTLLNKNNSLRAAASDARAKTMALENRLAEKDRLYKEQRSECDRLACEVKRLRAEAAAAGGRQAAREDAVASLNQQLAAAKAEYLEFRDSTRALSISHQQAISTLEARIKALTTTIDKQTELIDNLRRQSALLAAEGALAVTEKSYWAFLNED